MSRPVLKRLNSVRRSITMKSKVCIKEETVEKIKLEDFNFYQNLSRVSNGMLKLCKNIETGNYYCIKILKKMKF